MKKAVIYLDFILVLAFVFSVAGQTPANPRGKYSFNSGWRLFVGDPFGAERTDFDDSRWQIVTTPRPWNQDEAFRKDIKDLPTGIALVSQAFQTSRWQQRQKGLSRI